MTDGRRAEAATPASAAPAFPVLAVVIMSAPSSHALATTTALARSLNDAVVLRLSSLKYKFCNPSELPRNPARHTGVQPIGNGVTLSRVSSGSKSQYRQIDLSLACAIWAGAVWRLISA